MMMFFFFYIKHYPITPIVFYNDYNYSNLSFILFSPKQHLFLFFTRNAQMYISIILACIIKK